MSPAADQYPLLAMWRSGARVEFVKRMHLILPLLAELTVLPREADRRLVVEALEPAPGQAARVWLVALRLALAGCPTDVLNDPLGRRFTGFGFLSHLHSLMVTMSQKSSLTQAAKSVSQVLMPDSPSYEGHPSKSSRIAALPPGPHRVHCDRCAFTYRINPRFPRNWRILDTGPVWEEALRDAMNQPDPSFSDIAKRLGVEIITIQRHVHRLGLPIENWALSPKWRRKGHVGRRRRAIQRHRERWLRAREDNPESNTRQLMDILKGSYNFLLRHDREWLAEHIPSAKVYDRAAEFWERRDGQLVERARQAVRAVLAAEGKPERITFASIGRRMVGRAISLNDCRNLPMLRAFLVASRETTTDFARRRLKWTIEQNRAKGVTRTPAGLAKQIGLNRSLCAELEADLLEAARAA
jgi:hypothetical protein